MSKIISCDRCDGTGHMTYHDACDMRDYSGVWPLRMYGCIKCDGLGEIGEVEDETET